MTLDTTQSGYRVFIPIKTVNANAREHHFAKHRRVKKEREAVLMLVRKHELPPLPALVTFIRHGSRLMDTGDNLPICFKALRDQIAELYGVDDADPRLKWAYDQKKVKRVDVGVMVLVAGL